MIDIEAKRTFLIKFVRNTIYRALGFVTGIVLILIFYFQNVFQFTHAPISALLTMVAAWIILFVCEYYVFLIKNYSSEIIDRLFNHVQSVIK